MHARLFFRTNRIKRAFSRSLKTALLSLVLVLTIAPFLAPALAQNTQNALQTQIRNVPGANRTKESPLLTPYNTLFDKSSTERSALNVSADWSTARYATDLTYTFNGGFDVEEGEESEQAAEYWNKIADNIGSRNLFVLRVCNVDTNNRPVETTCAFSPWPYGSNFADDWDAPVITNFTPAQFTQLVLDVKTALSKKIYHYVFRAEYENDEFRYTPASPAYAFSVDYKPDGFQYNNDSIGQYGKALEPGKRYQADLWYCLARGGGLGDITEDAAALQSLESEVDNIRIIRLCDSSHLAYARAAGVQFDVPQTDEQIAAANAANTNADLNSNVGGTTEKIDVMPNCHILNGWGPGTGSFVGCIAFLFYYGIFWPISWFAGIMGNLFDFFLGYSLDDASYRAEFVVTGWKLVRDISNIFFIIILVWVGLATALSISKVSMKKVVPQLILNALIINFSLFGTRLLIDVSNIAARIFYNTISVCEGECRDDDNNGQIDNPKRGSTQYKPLSEKIVSAFDPQRIFTPSLLTNTGFADSRVQEGDRTAGTIIETGDDLGKDKFQNKNSYATVFVIISIIAAFLMLATALMFWKTAFFFLGRTVGLYISMIFAPFAVLTLGNMPIVGGIPQISWKNWWSDFIKYVTLAPIFVFFLYIIYSFMSTDFLKIVAGRDTDGLFGGGFMPTIISISVPLLIVYFMVKQGVKIAETYAGTIGTMVQSEIGKRASSFGGAAVATAAGVASGGLAAIGRGSIGRIGASMANSETLRKWSGSNNWLARGVGNAGVLLGQKGAKAEFDIRNTGLLKTFGVSGKEYKPVMRMTRTGTENTKGGIVGSTDRKEKRLYDRMKTFQLSGDMKREQDAKAAAWEQKHKAELDAFTAARGGTISDSEKRRFDINFKNNNGEKPQTAKEINLERNKQYVSRIKKGTLLSRFGKKIATATGVGSTGTGVAAVATGMVNTTAGAIAGGAVGAVAGIVGEHATARVAEERVGSTIDQLNKLENEIEELEKKIKELESKATAGTISDAERDQLKKHEKDLASKTKKRDDINNKLTGKN